MIGIAFPCEKSRKIFYNNSEVIFIDNEGFWVLSNICSQRVLSKNVKHKNHGIKFDTNLAKSYLDWYMPVWTRWVSKVGNYDHKIDQSLLFIYKIFIMLDYYKIKSVIFTTSVAHHIEDIFLSIACRLKKIKQIYLYGQVINGRLLPILQTEGIESRVCLDIEVSSFTFKKIIDEFINRKKQELFPSVNFLSKNWKKSLTLTGIFLLRREILKKFNYIKEIYFAKNLKSSFLEPSAIKKYSIIEDLKAINNQRLYLKKLSKIIISDKDIQVLKLNKKPKLLIAAHMQPEATSFPEGNKYSNHIDIVMVIRNKKYKSEIVYKEHFSTYDYLCNILGLTKVGISRSTTYLELLKKYGCIFLPSTYNLSISRDYNWYVPVTITGTIALERALVGLTTIYTGVPWYKGMPGTIYIDDIDSLEEIPLEWTNPDPLIALHSRNFLEKMLNNKTIANLSGIATGVRDNSEESVKDFESGIIKILDFLNKDNKSS